ADGAVAVGFHPAGTLLVSGGWDQSARLWRLGGWKPSLAVTMGEHVGSGVSVPGSDMVLVGSGSEAAFLDLTTSQTKPLVATPAKGIYGWFAFAGPEMLRAVTSSGVKEFQPPYEGEGSLLIEHAPITAPVASTADGKILATGLVSNAVRLWERATAKPLGPVLQQKGLCTCMAFSPDGTRLLTGSLDGRARLWEVPSGALLFTWKHEDSVQAVAFSPDGKLAVSGGRDDAARIWDPATGQTAGLPLIHPGNVMAIAFSPDGRTILTGNQNRNDYLWDVRSRRQLGPALPHPESVLGVAFLADGKRFVTGCYDGKVRLFELPSPLADPPASIQAWIERI